MRFLFAFFSVLFLTTQTLSQVKLPQVIKDSMILQRDAKLNIWGWAKAGENVSVRFNNKTYKTKTGDDGKWKLQLQPTKAGGPYTMNIDASNHLTLKEILVGDVWLCTGQSNMVHQMGIHNVLYADDIANANFPAIRQFWIPTVANMQGPQQDISNGNWKWANPNDVKDFSAVAYFFARQLHQKYGVPIGIINASYGGTPIEAWISEEGFKEFPAILETIAKNKDTSNTNRRPPPTGNRPAPPEDKGITQKWFDPSYSPKGWRNIAVPGYWEDQGVKDLDGVVWYRKEIDVPASMLNKPAKVFLGRIVDADVLYINGKQVGQTTYMYPQRRYQIPDGVLKAGKNLLVVKITNNNGKGGFVPDKPFQLIAGNDTANLTGYWQYKVGLVNPPFRGFGGGGGGFIDAQNQPTGLYNSMLAPVVPYNVKGFVWYQGESNTGRSADYIKLQPALIADLRNHFNAPNAPFLFVQLPGFMDYNYQPSESQWAQFREAQAKSLTVANTAMAVAIDLGEWNDIHPDRKKEVGERLALAAENIAYGDKTVLYQSPMYQSATIDGNKITISFTGIGSGLTTSDGEEVSDFAIAGADKKFVWAKAKIDGDKITVWSDAVAEPKYVRYAWADNPVNPNLMNKEGLPASPFRTDEP